jgi:hypothetical protein
MLLPPLAFLGALAEAEEFRQEWLRRMKDMWRTCEALESEAQVSAEARDLQDSLLFPSMHFCRWVFLNLAEVDFQYIPSGVQQAIAKFGAGHGSTLMIENMFGDARRLARANARGKTSAQALWHQAAVVGKVAENFGRPAMPVLESARGVTTDGLAKELFNSESHQCTLGEEALGELKSKKTKWKQQGPGTINKAGLRWMSVVKHQGSLKAAQQAWLSLLLEPGVVACQTGSRRVALVLVSGPYGFLSVRTPLRQGPPTIWDSSKTYPHHVLFDAVTDVNSWRVGTTDMLVPGLDQEAPGSVALKLSETKSLLAHAASTGFRQLGVMRLRALWRVLAVPEEGVALQAMGEAELVKGLARFALPHVDGIEEHSFAARFKVQGMEEQLDEGMGEHFAELMEDMRGEADEDDAELAASVTALREQLERARSARERRRAAALGGELAAAPPAAPPAAPAAAAPRARLFIARPEGPITAAMAQQWCPPGCRVSKDDRRENRWRLRGDVLRVLGLGAERSRAWGPRGAADEWQALIFVLRLGWAAHQQATGEDGAFGFGPEAPL